MKTIFCIFSIMLFLLSLSANAVFAGGTDTVENIYYSIEVPDNWAYSEGSSTPQAQTTGFGPVNQLLVTPDEFSDMLLGLSFEQYSEKIQEGGLSARFSQDTVYPVKNAPLESYVKYVINYYGIQNITSQQYSTVGNEKAVRISANQAGGYGDSKIVLYVVMNDRQLYEINYIANPKYYEKYLPEFEQMVKSLRFTDSALSESEKSENENTTGTRTNFSSANASEFTGLSELYTNGTNNSNYPEELYDQCIGVAGKSFCDFLFKR